MPRFHTDMRLDEATAEFGPYVDSYWRDFDRDPVYAAFVQAWFIDQAGNLIGISNHCAAPNAEVPGRDALHVRHTHDGRRGGGLRWLGTARA